MEQFRTEVTKEEDTFIVKCPEIGTVSQGKTAKEALKNLKEATELYLEEFPDKEPNSETFSELTKPFRKAKKKIKEGEVNSVVHKFRNQNI